MTPFDALLAPAAVPPFDEIGSGEQERSYGAGDRRQELGLGAKKGGLFRQARRSQPAAVRATST